MKKLFISLAVIGLAFSMAGCKPVSALPDPSITVTTLNIPAG